MFVLDAALAARGVDIAAGWAASLTMGAGQFCTNPGIALVKAGADADAFEVSAKQALEDIGGQTMLTDGIASTYQSGMAKMAAAGAVRTVLSSECSGRTATPFLFATTAQHFLANHDLAEEVFGPLGLIVTVSDDAEREKVAKALVGQLTYTLQMDEPDVGAAAALMPVLERKAGRVLVNGFPTGVEVSDTMVHGGPYPASTNFGATSVGTMSIRRFLRPDCYQNLPDALLPADLR